MKRIKQIKFSGLDTGEGEGEEGECSTLSHLDQCTFGMRKEFRTYLKRHDQGNLNKVLFSTYVPLREHEG